MCQFIKCFFVMSLLSWPVRVCVCVCVAFAILAYLMPALEGSQFTHRVNWPLETLFSAVIMTVWIKWWFCIGLRSGICKSFDFWGGSLFFFLNEIFELAISQILNAFDACVRRRNAANVKCYMKTRPTSFCSVEVVGFPFLKRAWFWDQGSIVPQDPWNIQRDMITAN